MENKNYKAANYTVEIEVARSLNYVFDHVIDVSKWWPEEFDGESIRLNSEFVFTTGDSHYSKNKVVEFVPDKKVAWLTTESKRNTDDFDWTGTKFIFEFAPKRDNTLVRFTYDGVVFENEYDRLVQICDMTIKEMLYNFVINGNKNFIVAIGLAGSTRDVFKAITDDVAKWWGGKDLGGRSTKLNDEFIIDHPGYHYSKQKLVEVVPDKRIVWLVEESHLHWLKKDPHEWTGTKMVFEIAGEAGITTLHFTHEGLIPEKECYQLCSQGWNTVIKDYLFNFIMSGTAHFTL
jgi:hypothetical protein